MSSLLEGSNPLSTFAFLQTQQHQESEIKEVFRIYFHEIVLFFVPLKIPQLHLIFILQALVLNLHSL